MNMQSILNQANKIKKEMCEAQEKINNSEYIGTSSIVSVKMKGTKEVVEVKIKTDELNLDDIELLQDMILVAVNDAITKIDKEIEEKMGKYTKGMPGLF